MASLTDRVPVDTMPAPLVEVVSGPWKGRRIASPPDAVELRTTAMDFDPRSGRTFGARGADVYHRKATGWAYLSRLPDTPTGFVVFAYPPKRHQ